MSAGRFTLVLLALFGLVRTTLAQGTGGQGVTVNMDFNYTFFDNLAPTADPTEAELFHLVCQTQQWVSQVVKNRTGNPTLTMQAVDIDYQRGIGENGTGFGMTFTGQFNTAPGGSLPTSQDIVTALDPRQVNTVGYIENYVYQLPSDGSPNYWRDVNGIDYIATFGNPRPGRVAAATCDATIAPTFPGGDNSTTMPPDAGGNGTDPNGGGPLGGTDPTTGGTDPNSTDPTTGGPGGGGPNDPDAGGPLGGGSGPNGTDPTSGGPSGGGPNDPNAGGPLGNGTDLNGTFPTLAPSPLGSAPNTDDMVFFTLEYGFVNDTARPPTQQEIEELICKTNLFFRDQLRNDTNDTTIQSEAMYIDWTFKEDAIYPVEINFTASVTNGDGETVPEDVVFQSMELTFEEIVVYIKEYTWETDPDSLFFQTESVNFTDQINVPVPLGQLETVTCPETPMPSTMPSVSPAPTLSFAPSSMPSVSAAPSTSSMPSIAPSISSAPTSSPTAAPTTVPVPGSPTSGGGPGSPTVGGGDGPPTISPMPTPTANWVERQPISVKFLVSNLEGITEPDQVNASGLSVSWPVFAEEVVANITQGRNSQRRLRANGRRFLAVANEPGTSNVDVIVLADCPTGSHPDATCHNATASYVLLLTDEEDPEAVEDVYATGTLASINGDRYQPIMEQEYNNTPLQIGIIPAPTDAPRESPEDDDDGMPIWLIILIVLLCVLCCLCILAALFFLMRQKQQEEKELEPYDEEGFVYDFLIPPNQKPQTEVDDDAETKDVDDEGEENETFEDEDDDGLRNIVPIPPPEESVALIEAEDFDDEDGEEEEEDDDGDDFDEGDDDINTRQVEDDEDGELSPNLIPVDNEEEAPPEGDDDDDDAVAPDPDATLGVHDDPDGIGPSDNLEDVDDEDEDEDSAEDEGAGEEEEQDQWQDEDDVAEGGGDEAGGDDEGWNDDEENEGDAEEGWDGEGEAGEAGAEEEWDENKDDGAAAEEEWEEGSDEEGWDDEDEK